jgi:phosphomannomutase
MLIDPTIFKAYDIRGTYPDQINAPAVGRIAQAYAAFVRPKVVAVGRDVRQSGIELQKAVIDALLASGVNVVDIGPVPTELIYFAVGYYHYDGGIQVSASHNPPEYNGLKMIRAGVEAISSDTGLLAIKELAESDEKLTGEGRGELHSRDVTEDYLDFLTGFAHFDGIRPLKIVANNNFGLNGGLAQKLLKRLVAGNIELIELNFEPDGSFPKGRPDPMIPENRAETSSLVRSEKADLAVAWDADGDRCYFADENGEFIEGCHLTALLAAHLLENSADQAGGQKVLYDPRNVWAVEETVRAAGGTALLNKAGHTFIKNRMRQEDALFAGEMSGHFYFREFYYADNGLIPFLLLLNILHKQPDKQLGDIVRPLREQYHVSGEINFKVKDALAPMRAVEAKYAEGQVDRTDGLSVELDQWRFNLRPSNTEPLLRLNVEAKADEALCRERTTELRHFIETLNNRE